MFLTRSFSRALCLCGALFLTAATSHAQSTLLLDDFENGIDNWTRNDKTKADAPDSSAVLIDVLATQPAAGGALNSRGAALFTFKAAKNSWASASLKVNGRNWAKIGARVLKFWLNADGQSPGVDLLLRGQIRGGDGRAREVVYQRAQPVGLTFKSWREIALPLNSFRDAAGRTADTQLDGIYLLQFAQRGSWDSRFFTVDDIRITGTGVPTPSATPEPVATPIAATGESDGKTIPLSIDFLKLQSRIRRSANVSIGARWSDANGQTSFPLESSPEFQSALQTLDPRFVRLDGGTLVELVDSARPGFDFARLVSSALAVRARGLEPLIALPAPPAWALDARGYTAFVDLAARALVAADARPRYFELPTGATTTPASALLLYNRGYAALKAVLKTSRIGGGGSADAATLKVILDGAHGLDFLSLPFYASHTSGASSKTLFDAIRNPTSLRAARVMLDGSKFRNAPLYVTGANLSSSRSTGVVPDEARLSQLIAGAWWAMFLGNSSRIGDQVFHNDAVNPEWGLLNKDASAYPAYYAMWLWNTFFPAGSTRVETKIEAGRNPGGALYATAVNTATAHNVLLVNTSENAITTRLSIRGFPVLRSARLRLLREPLDPVKGITFRDLPKSPFQTISLPPYAVAVLQFIEPPKKKR